MSLIALADEFEREIIKGRARFIAELNESFRDYSIKGANFDLYIRGQTRSKGFALSKFFAWTALPNYRVALYGRVVRDAGQSTRRTILELVDLIRSEIKENDLKWAWLVLFADEDLPTNVQNLVERFDINEVGIGVLNANSGKLLHSNNLVGRSLKRYMRVDRLVRRLARKTP